MTMPSLVIPRNIETASILLAVHNNMVQYLQAKRTLMQRWLPNNPAALAATGVADP